MDICGVCQSQLHETARFCAGCGTPVTAQMQAPADPLPYPPPPTWQDKGMSPHHMATRGFTQLFGLHPTMAAATVITDVMLHAGVIITGGLLIPFSILAGVVLAFVTYRAQQQWYEDDSESALIKALLVGLLTAIPSPLPYMFFIPAGIVGLLNNARKGRS